MERGAEPGAQPRASTPWSRPSRTRPATSGRATRRRSRSTRSRRRARSPRRTRTPGCAAARSPSPRARPTRSPASRPRDFQYSPAGANTWTTIDTDTSSPYSVSWDTTVPHRRRSTTSASITTDNAGEHVHVADPHGEGRTTPTRRSACPNASGTLGNNGWYTGTVTVTWPTQPTDAYSGIASTTGCGTTTISTEHDRSGRDLLGDRQRREHVVELGHDQAGHHRAERRRRSTRSAPTSPTARSSPGPAPTRRPASTRSRTSTARARAAPRPPRSAPARPAATYPVTWNGMPANGVVPGAWPGCSTRPGNSLNSAMQTVTIDTTAPTGSITAPARERLGARQSVTVTVELGRHRVGRAVRDVPALAERCRHLDDDRHRHREPVHHVVEHHARRPTAPTTCASITQDNAGNTLHLGDRDGEGRQHRARPSARRTLAGTLGNNGWYTSNVTVTWPTQPTDAYSASLDDRRAGRRTSPPTPPARSSPAPRPTTPATRRRAPVTIKRDATIPSAATLTLARPRSTTARC